MITSLERSKIVVANRDREGVGRGLAVPWKTEADLIRERWREDRYGRETTASIRIAT